MFKRNFAIVALSGLALTGLTTTPAVSAAPEPVRAVEVVTAPVVADSDAVVQFAAVEAVTVVAAEPEPVAEVVTAPVQPVLVEAAAVEPAAPVAVAVTPVETVVPVAPALVTPTAEEPAPVTYNSEDLVIASDGSALHPDFLAAYEADLAAGVEQAVGFAEPVIEVVPDPEAPVLFDVPIPATPEQELELPKVFGPENLVEATDGSMVHVDDIAGYEAELAAGVEQAVGFSAPSTPEQAFEDGALPPGHTQE